MEPAKRIIVNTTAQYARAIINTCLSLYSVRLILDALGVADYGIYAVIGGVVAMLGFITNALVITTQRYISYHHGRGDSDYVKILFTNSLLLHISLGILLALILLSLKSWLFEGGILTIDSQRIDVAVKVYYITIFMLLTTIVTAPFKALFIARENIVYISIVEICDGVIKLIFAISLAYVGSDKLLTYASMMAIIQVLNFLAFAIYANWKFEECRLAISPHDIKRPILFQLVGFAGWTTYGAGALATRAQGTAVIINHFLGTTVNAAYGIAAQVNSAIFIVSAAIVNAMNPQIMKAEGSGNRQKVLALAGKESKYSAVLLSIISIPILMELPEILSVWLKEVPKDAAMFCTFTLAACLCDQLTIGLNAVNQAQGKIGVYSILTFTPKLLNLPIAWFFLHEGFPLISIMWAYILIECFVMLLRIPYLKRTAGLNVNDYLRNTILPLLPLIAILLLISWGCTIFFHFRLRFLLTVPISIIAGIITAWEVTLNNSEREYIGSLINNRIKRR